MARKASKPTGSDAGAHHRGRSTGAGRLKLRTRAKDSPESREAGAGAASVRIDLTRIGTHARFVIRHNEEVTVTSRLYDKPKEAKQSLIALLMAIQADDLESFDHT